MTTPDDRFSLDDDAAWQAWETYLQTTPIKNLAAQHLLHPMEARSWLHTFATLAGLGIECRWAGYLYTAGLAEHTRKLGELWGFTVTWTEDGPGWLLTVVRQQKEETAR